MYYPQCDFLHDCIGSNSSYCWRSILVCHNLLRRGYVKRIGNGRLTDIWGQPWLPNVTDPYIHSPFVGVHANMNVSSHINPLTNDWDLDRINKLFVPHDVDLIQKIPISMQFGD